MFYPIKKPFFSLLFLLAVLGLAACGTLEFGVETKVSSGRPEVTVVTTTIAEIPEGMVLVTVTPWAQATALGEVTGTPTAVTSQLQTPAATVTPTPTALETAVQSNPTRPPAWPPANTPTPTPSWAEILIYPTVSDIIWPGDSVTVTYDVRAESATLCLAPVFTENWVCDLVPASGPYTLDINPATTTTLQLQLNAYLNETQATGTAIIELYCDEDAWFFSGPPTTCPGDQPVQTAAAYQRFEHGFMLWLAQGQWWGEPDEVIYVLYDTQTFEPFPAYTIPDSSVPMPNIEYDPPEGMFVPDSGFGALWKENSWIRQRLGWALAPEVGFSTTVQRGFSQDGPFLYLLDFDGRLLALDLWTSNWAERSQP